VRLIDQNGNQAGVVTIKDALFKAEQAGLDLVEIAQNVDPPVCKILDFGKYRYEIQKQKKVNKKKQHVIQVKEIRIRPNTGDHDLITKLNKAQKFIASGAKLKITVMFRGREMSRKEAGMALLKRVTDILEDVAKIDKSASMEGRRMSIILSPR
jgi:translation initiation factor IF-3